MLEAPGLALLGAHSSVGFLKRGSPLLIILTRFTVQKSNQKLLPQFSPCCPLQLKNFGQEGLYQSWVPKRCSDIPRQKTRMYLTNIEIRAGFVFKCGYSVANACFHIAFGRFGLGLRGVGPCLSSRQQEAVTSGFIWVRKQAMHFWQ